MWDVGAGEALTVIDCHVDIIYSLSFNRDGSRIATTSKDKKLRVIDPRTGLVISVNITKSYARGRFDYLGLIGNRDSQEGVCHQGSRSSKVVYLSEGRVLTTGFSQHSDRQIAIWKENDLREPIKREMVDSSSGILFPFFDFDTHVLFLAGKVG